MRRSTINGLAALGLSWACASAAGAAVKPFDICFRYFPATAEEQIAACSDLIAAEHNKIDLSRLLTNRGAQYLNLHQNLSAFADLDRAIELEPTNMEALADRAAAHRLVGDGAAAAADYALLLAIKPRGAEGFLSHGLAHEALNQPDLALADYDEAIGHNPKIRHTTYVALLHRAQIREHRFQMDLALPDYDQAAEIEPTPLALARTCWARVALNRDLDRALSKCEASLALVPGAALQLSVRAAVYYRMGRYQEALRDCDQALSGDQNQTVAIMICGLSKRRVGDRASGDADVARAGAMNPAMAKAYARYGLSP